MHGIAELLVVLEGEQLNIELHSPAINLLGFEHHPNTIQQKARIDTTKVSLTNATNLFQLEPDNCQLVDHKIDFSNILHQSTQHDEEPHEEHNERQNHSDLKAQYHYRCKRAGELRSLTTTIFSEFPTIETLRVQWIIDGRQGATTLDPEQHHAVFK